VARLDPLKFEDLTSEQRLLHAELLRTRQRVGGPFAIWLRNPSLADSANRLALALREHGKLEKRLFELIVLIVVRHWSAEYAWASHAPNAENAGISRDMIKAIRNRHRPDFKRPDEKVIYEVVSELLETKELGPATYDCALAQFGLDLTVEIITVAGFYGMVATVLKGFDVPTPTGDHPFGNRTSAVPR
jgi:4-carboxymuconolactone decarboxylase